ncbi:MAG TPA: ATP-binding protein [Thermodesulfovibrionales bacterium]|jgi:predicted AAA+ superfamily ATPase|nr:ATP-binding protein [Thermodesulfovibrionales bacterium]
MNFIKRSITNILLQGLTKEHIVVLTGARQTGKTTLCESILPGLLGTPFSYISFDDPDERLRFQKSAIEILESLDTPLIILDEVQKIPALFDPLKYVVDKQKKQRIKRSYILTGSSQILLMKNIKETLSGRVALFNLYPFSLSEVIGSSNTPFLTWVWEGKTIKDNNLKSFNILSTETTRNAMTVRNEHQHWGGYPPIWMRKTKEDKIKWLKDYRKTYIERDVLDVGQIANIDNFIVAQKLLCARTGQIFSISEVARDLSLAVNTIKRYINLLSMSFQCYLLPPYYENIGKRFIKSPKIFFPDAGLNRVILGEAVVSSGAFYETWVFSELLKWRQLQPIEPEIFFYRTSGGMEIDFLIYGDKTILPIEAKNSDKVSYTDGRHLESFISTHKKTSHIGIVVYRGREIKEIRTNIWAIPDWYLFGGV